MQVLHSFVDHNTAQRIQFVDSEKHAANVMPRLLDMSKMERCLSGTSDYQYNFDSYSAEMVALDQRRHYSARGASRSGDPASHSTEKLQAAAGGQNITVNGSAGTV